MARWILLHDRTEILAALSSHRAAHAYAIGDLDDFFFPHTVWLALTSGGRPRQVAMLYTQASPPTLLAIAPERPEEMAELLDAILPVLPRRFYLHVTPGAAHTLTREYELSFHGLHHKMALVSTARLEGVDTTSVIALGPPERAEIEAFYAAAYPKNWFDARMLETGYYVGIRDQSTGLLASVAGVHVCSRAQRIAALGNIATRPDTRGRGLAASTIAALCRTLAKDHDTIALNVHSENSAAIRLYERLGFARVADYEEHMVTARPTSA